MSLPDVIIEAQLRKVDRRWRWLQLLQHSATMASLVLGLGLLVGLALVRGWIATPGVASALVALLILGCVLGWLILLMVVLGKSLPRNHIARSLERAHPTLMDRLNTLVFLESSRVPDGPPFYRQIAHQAGTLLQHRPASAPVSSRRALLHVGMFLVLLGVTFWFVDRYSPWQQLMKAHRARLAASPGPSDPPNEPPAEVLLPPAETHETIQPWGEVRITDPGRDVKLTKVDVLPLEIEAAASAALSQTAWTASINGGEERVHPLPPAAEPRYGVYQPEIYLDELPLADWDVLSYYAWARTEPGDRYASDIYFVEIRPFREDILKLPGGSGGEAYQVLSELTSLVERQQHILRDTHRHLQQPPQDPRTAEQDLGKLADAETDLRQAIEHLHARLASEVENKPIGEALDHLTAAREQAQGAADALRKREAAQAQPKEHQALTQLVSARKSFQRAVSDNPDRFQEETPPAVANTQAQLNSMAEFRDEFKAAVDFLQSAVERQQALADQAERGPVRDYPKIARSQRDLRESVQEFQGQHPRLFKDLDQETAGADQAMKEAADSLAQRKPQAEEETRQAAEQLRQLDARLREQNSSQQLADAYRLKQMLDRQIETLGQCQSAPGSFSASDLARAAGESRQTLEQLSQVANDPQSGGAFSQPLRDVLSPDSRRGIEQSLRQLEQAQSDQAKTQRAAQARQGLTRVSEAFDQSQPKVLQDARRTDPLEPGASDERLARGLDRLERLVRQLQDPQRADNRESQAQLGQQALYDLQSGLTEPEGSNEASGALLVQLREALAAPERPLDGDQLGQLLDQLRRFSRELAGTETAPSAPPDLSNIDPALLPPAYRSQIERYYQKLSER